MKVFDKYLNNKQWQYMSMTNYPHNKMKLVMFGYKLSWFLDVVGYFLAGSVVSAIIFGSLTYIGYIK